MTVWVCFVDGIGLTDPIRAPWATALLPTLDALLPTRPWAGLRVDTPTLLFQAVDATLGVAGRPQSGTGHTTLWTGINAAARLGRHFPAYPAPSQRPLIAEHSLFRRVVAAGQRVAIATAHRARYWELVVSRQQRATAAALAALAADLPLPDSTDYAAGRAVAWDITGAYLQRWGADTPPISAAAAGARLAALGRNADLVHYECYLPDFVGHGRIDEQPERVLELVDALLGSLLASKPPDGTVLLISDHGNLEEPEHQQHTRNPVPLLIVGPRPPLPPIRSIADIAAVIEALLGLPSTS